jgi:hypothetical protein
MCFSIEASFATGAALLPAGLYCVRTSLLQDRRYLALAVMPLVFALQQALEGFVWLGLRREDPDLARVASLGFLFFAIVFWPCWMPLSVLKLASRRWTRRVLGAAAVFALGISLLVFLPLAMRSREWLHPAIRYHSIEYSFSMLPAFLGIPTGVWHVGYVALVALPLLVQVSSRLTAFSCMIIASAILAQGAFAYAFVSIWCAFAALLSAWLCFLFHGLQSVVPPPLLAVQGAPPRG